MPIVDALEAMNAASDSNELVERLVGMEPAALIGLTRVGLPSVVVDHLSAFSGLPRGQLVEMLRTTDSTDGHPAATGVALSPDQSECLLAVTQLLYRVLRMLGGDRAQLAQWLCEPIPSLGWRKPSELVAWTEGRRLLMQNLLQIKTGTYG